MKIMKKCYMKMVSRMMVFILFFQFIGMIMQNKILAEDTSELTQYVQSFVNDVSDNEEFSSWKGCEVALEQLAVIRSKNGVNINQYVVYNENGIHGTVLCSEYGEVAYYSINHVVDDFVYGYCSALTLKTVHSLGSKSNICQWRQNNFGSNASFTIASVMHTRSSQ